MLYPSKNVNLLFLAALRTSSTAEGARIKDTNQGKTDKIKKIQGLVFTVHPPCSRCAILSALTHAEREPGTIIAGSSLAALEPASANGADCAGGEWDSDRVVFFFSFVVA